MFEEINAFLFDFDSTLIDTHSVFANQITKLAEYISTRTGQDSVKIKEMIFNIPEDPEQGLSALKKLSNETDNPKAGAPSSDNLDVTLTYFPPLPDKNLLKASNLLKHFNGRILLLIEE